VRDPAGSAGFTSPSVLLIFELSLSLIPALPRVPEEGQCRDGGGTDRPGKLQNVMSGRCTGDDWYAA